MYADHCATEEPELLDDDAFMDAYAAMEEDMEATEEAMMEEDMADMEATEEMMEEAEETGALPDLDGVTITVAVENAYPPFNFIDPSTNEAAGWDYDAVTEMCDRLNCEPEFVEAAWEGMILAVSEGEYDMAADGITITEEREEIVDFSTGYVQFSQFFLVRTDEDRFETADELAENEELLVGSQPATTNYDAAVDIVGEERILAFETFPVAVQALLAGDVDVVIIDNVAGQAYIEQNPDELVFVGEPLTSEELGFIFPEGSELTAAFDAVIADMEADGTLDELFQTWFIEFDLSSLDGEEAVEEEADAEMEATEEAMMEEEMSEEDMEEDMAEEEMSEEDMEEEAEMEATAELE